MNHSFSTDKVVFLVSCFQFPPGRNDLISFGFLPWLSISHLILPLRTRQSCLRYSVVCALLLAFQLSSVGSYPKPTIIPGINIQKKKRLVWFPWALTLVCLWAPRALVPQINLLLWACLGRGSPSVTRWFLCSTVWCGLIAQFSSEGGKDSPSLAKNCLLVAFFQAYASGTITFWVWKGFRLPRHRTV